MENEKQKILKRIDELITKKKNEMLRELPSIHEIDDGIIIRFFNEWDNCEDDNKIRYKKIVNHFDDNDSTVFFYIPKDSFFDLKQKFWIGNLICVNGKLEITVDDKTSVISGYSKTSVNSDEVQGLALENTYIITEIRNDHH